MPHGYHIMQVLQANVDGALCRKLWKNQAVWH